MGGIDLFKQGCVWVQFQKQDFVAVALEGLCRERLGVPLYLGYNSAIRHFVELPRLLDFDDFYCLCDSISVKIPPTKEAEDAVYSKSFCTITKASNLSNAKKDASSSKVVIMEPTSLVEMERIMNSSNHYEVLGLLRNKSVDHNILKKEYHKKVLLVHPDKNMGSSLACESFKKLQCAYEVLSDLTKKKNYDEQLRKEEHGREYQRPSVISQQEGQSSILKNLGVLSAQSVEILIYGYAPTEDCSQYHQAKDGDGWVESGCQPVVMTLQKMEIPRAFVCAESKVFDVSEWAICQGMTCRSNTHGPSFHVNMVALDSTGLRSNSSTYSWGLDAKLVVEDDEFELWLQEALASGIFSETPKRRKSWPFKINQKGMKPWRRSP
ncbi:heat shock protein DnaJ [Musa troglodytarum]|uniref:Heat shock protein DnaJ n=1 Tax=Musa troglodytarum TaxID=320322 RepID=A0A9E7L323_9LILI|nr:heat shock protein DnaJ [Musa troglodytarum]